MTSTFELQWPLNCPRSIKRVIFETVRKSDGVQYTTLDISSIKQIGGRAGRYKAAPFKVEAPLAAETSKTAPAASTETSETSVDASQSNEADQIRELEAVAALGRTLEAETADTEKVELSTTPETAQALFPAPPPPSTDAQTVGWVTTLEDEDYQVVRAAMSAEAEPILTAGILPPAHVIRRFSRYFPPGTPFSYVLLRLHEISQINHRFHLCRLKDHIAIADAIECVKGLTPEDRIMLCQSPCAIRDPAIAGFVAALAQAVANRSGGSLLELPGMDLEILDQPIQFNRKFLQRLEFLHKQLIQYLWLSFRFQGIFHTRALAMHVKELVEKAIEKSLAAVHISERARRQARMRQREAELLNALRKEGMFEGQTDQGGAAELAKQSRQRGYMNLNLASGSQDASTDRAAIDVKDEAAFEGLDEKSFGSFGVQEEATPARNDESEFQMDVNEIPSDDAETAGTAVEATTAKTTSNDHLTTVDNISTAETFGDLDTIPEVADSEPAAPMGTEDAASTATKKQSSMADGVHPEMSQPVSTQPRVL